MNETTPKVGPRGEIHKFDSATRDALVTKLKSMLGPRTSMASTEHPDSVGNRKHVAVPIGPRGPKLPQDSYQN